MTRSNNNDGNPTPAPLSPMPTEYATDYDYNVDEAAGVPLFPLIDYEDIDNARAMTQSLIDAFNETVDFSAVTMEDGTAPGIDGGPDVPVRIFRPKDRNGSVPALLDIHGGGFCVGDMGTNAGWAADVVTELGIVIVSPDYRLAPENPYPAGLNDCYSALVWMHENASVLKIDEKRIGVSGISAGGGLAAALALKTRDSGGPAICFAYLGTPELDDRLDTGSALAFVDTPAWFRHNAQLSWQYYLGSEFTPGGKSVPIYAAPARATDLSGLPSTYISAMEFDPLRDEGIIYALHLLEDGVKTELHVYPGTYHGSLLNTMAESSIRGREETMNALVKGLGIDTN